MTIRRRKDRDGWQVQVELYGERKRRQVSTKWEAERVERDLRHALRDGRPHYALGEALDAYTATLRTRAKPTSLEWVAHHRVRLERYLGSHFNLAELSQKDLDGLVGKLRADKWKDASINGSLAVLRATGHLAAREGHLLKPLRVTMLREVRRFPAILTYEQVEQLVAAATTDAALAILIAAHAGLRHQEILHLTAADIRNGKIHVTAKHGWSPKTYEERSVPINGRLALALEPRVRDRIGWLFPADRGPAKSLDKPVRKAFQAVGLWDEATKPGLHMLRRTWASTLLERGASLAKVMKLGGWAKISTVQRYLFSPDETDAAAVALLEG